MIRLFTNLLTSGINTRETDTEFVTRYRFLLVNTICLLVGSFFTAFGLYDILLDIQPLGWIASSLGLLIWCNFAFLRITKQLSIASYINVALLLTGFLYLLITGGPNNTGPLWLYGFPLATIFLLGVRGGLIVTGLFQIAIVLILYLPGTPLLKTVYSGEFKIRFVMTMVGMIILSFVIEVIRAKTNQRLVQKNMELAKTVTELSRAETALAEELERQAVTLRSIAEGIIAADTRGKINLFNPMAASLTGCPERQALGKSLGDIFRLVDSSGDHITRDPFRQVLETGETVTLHDEETLLEDLQGRRRPISASAAPVHDKENRIIGMVVTFRDMTKAQQLEEEILKARKLESVGLLAGGIAHDFNNILAGILGNSELARLAAADQKDPTAYLDTIEEASRGAQTLTDQLLTFAKGGAPIRKQTNISELLTSNIAFSLTGSHVQPRLNIADNLWEAKVDPGQMAQVICNLVINAKQAMAQAGTLDITASNVDNGHDHDTRLQSGPCIKIDFLDTGTGIRPEDLAKVFDPYFTTKEKGSGLGLATAYSIITKHQGIILVESAWGKGTKFTLYLPAETEPGPHPPRNSQPAVALASPQQSRGKILIMDDEEIIRNMVRAMLTRQGYDVVQAVDGNDAVDQYRQAMESGRPIDAVIMDLTIPGGMGGREAIGELRKIDPRVRAIVSSGYYKDAVMSDFQNFGFQACLSKPYAMRELTDVLHRVLGPS